MKHEKKNEVRLTAVQEEEGCVRGCWVNQIALSKSHVPSS